MNKANIIIELDKLYEIMKPFMRWVNGNVIKAYKEERKNENFNEMQDLYRFLRNVHDNEFKQLKYAWDLCTPERWAFYKLMKFKGLQEQKILKDAKEGFQDAWNKRYIKEIKNGNVGDFNFGRNTSSDSLDEQEKQPQ